MAALPIIIALAGTALSAASSFGAFDKKGPEVPDRGSKEVDEARRRALLRGRQARGVRKTILAGEQSGDPLVSRPSLLGGIKANQPGGPQPASGRL